MTQGPYQSSYGYGRSAAFAGLIDKSEDTISRINATRKLTSVVLGGHATGVYTIKYDGVTVATFEDAGASSLADIMANLLADLEADGTQTVEQSGLDTFLIESPDYDSSVAVTTETTGSTMTVTTLVAQEQEVPSVSVS